MRAYSTLADFGRMVARSAFAELRYSPLRLAMAIAGMCLVYLAPPIFALFAGGFARLAGAFAWAMMAISMTPTLRLYGRPLAGGVALPAIAVAYIVFTLEIRHAILARTGRLLEGALSAPTGKAAGV